MSEDHTIRIDGERLLRDLRELATFGKVGTGVDRTAFSEPDIEARRWLRERMADAGLAAAIDGVGNVVGRFPGDGPAVLIGSHTDSVPKGGWLDGAMGVMYGLEIARAALESNFGGAAVDVVSFQDEEGTFFPCLGSKSACGEIGAAEIDGAESPDGRKLPDMLAEHALAGAACFRVEPARHRAYLEAHIEQGPRLEAAGKRIGVVTGIVGIRRLRVRATGQADHAGTTPMAMRKDAGAAMVRTAHRVLERLAAEAGPESVWNIGKFSFEPGAANVVPSGAEMIVEFRDISVQVLDRMERGLHETIAEAADGGPVGLEAVGIGEIAPAAMDEGLGALIAAAAREHAVEPVSMPSGAGHDAMVLADHVPTAMLFVPSIGGRSHDTAEDTAEEDIVLGCQVLATTVSRLLRG